jgi:NADPH:quinone reductase-like Zn-dependent oxidoreductase
MRDAFLRVETGADFAMATMKSFRIHNFGGPDVLKEDEVPIPRPKDDEILVRVHAASINPIDLKIRDGSRGDAQKLPITMGRDVAGKIESWGSGAEGVSKGDAVFAMLDWDRGGYAQYVVVKAVEWAPAPNKIDLTRAGAVPLAAVTAYQGLFDYGGLQKGQRVLVHGGAGGVGHFAIQLAKAKGAWVATTVSAKDFEFVRGLGADQIIDYENQKFEDEVKDVDLVYDLIAGEVQERSFQVVKNGGAIISTLKEPDKKRAKAKNLDVAHYMAKPNGKELAEIGRLIDDGRVRPVVDSVFRFEDAAKAQEKLDHGHVRGKIVLEMVKAQDDARGASFGGRFAKTAAE